VVFKKADFREAGSRGRNLIGGFFRWEKNGFKKLEGGGGIISNGGCGNLSCLGGKAPVMNRTAGTRWQEGGCLSMSNTKGRANPGTSFFTKWSHRKHEGSD